MNFIPPLSIYILGNRHGYLCNNFKVGAIYLSFSKKTTSLSQQINFIFMPLKLKNIYDFTLTYVIFDFLEIIFSIHPSDSGDYSTIFVLIPLTILDLT